MNAIKTRLIELKQLHQTAVAVQKREGKALTQAEINLKNSEEAQKIIQGTASKVQQEVHAKIAGVVSQCLKIVFDDPYEFDIIFETKRGKTEARLVFVRDGVEFDPTNSVGVGVLDIASFALRVAALSLLTPPVRRLVVLDEPFRCLSANNTQRAAQMLETVCEQLDFQIIMVTHNESFHIGRVLELSESGLTEIKGG